MGVPFGRGGMGTLLVLAWLPKSIFTDCAAERCLCGRENRGAKGTPQSRRRVTGRRRPRKNKFAEAGDKSKNKRRATHETNKDTYLASRIASARGLEPGASCAGAPGSGPVSL